MSKTYNWHDGHGKVHTRPKRQGGGGGKPAAPKPTGLEYLNQPMSTQQIGQQADQMAGLQYGGQEQQLAQRQSAVQPWFQNYINTIQGAQTQTAAMQQPAIDQANQAVTNQHATLGIEPNSPASHDDQLAAAGRAALLKLGAESLQGIQNVGTTFLGNQQAIAPMYQQQVTQDLGNQQSALQAQKGAYRASTYGDLQKGERDYGLALRHQGVEDAAFQVDTAVKSGLDPTTGKPLPPKDRKDVITSGPFAGFTKGQVRGLSPEDKAALRKGAGKPASVITSGAFAGYTQSQLRKMSQGKKNRLISAYGSGKGGGKDANGNTTDQVRSRNSGFRKASTVASQIVQKGDSWKDVYQLLVVKYPTGDADTLKAVAMKATHTPIPAKLRGSLIKYGVRPGLLKSKAKAKVQNPTGGPPSSGAAGYPYGTGAGQVH